MMEEGSSERRGFSHPEDEERAPWSKERKQA
jgi:hypothetical protein